MFKKYITFPDILENVNVERFDIEITDNPDERYDSTDIYAFISACHSGKLEAIKVLFKQMNIYFHGYTIKDFIKAKGKKHGYINVAYQIPSLTYPVIYFLKERNELHVIEYIQKQQIVQKIKDF